MKTLMRIVLLLGIYLVVAHPAHALVGCGATTGGLAQFDQSTCGATSPFPSPAGGTSISTCQTLVAGTYTLTANLTTTNTSTCITLNDAVILDLAGFTITGKIVGSGINMSGMHIFSSAAGGTVTCSGDSGNTTCVSIANGSQNLTSAIEIDHITITNVGTSSAVSERNMFIDWNPGSSTLGTAFGAKFHHITSTAATGLTSTRIANLWINSNSKMNVEYNNNKTTCLSTAAACQGMVTFAVNDVKVHNNWIVNQLNNASTSETARALDIDGNLPSQAATGVEIYNNYIDTQDGRAIRFRNVTNASDVTTAHDNLIDNVTRGSTSNYVAAIHVCDPDSGNNDGSSYVFSANSVNITDGTGLFSRNCTGFPQFSGNIIGCIVTCSGQLAVIGTPINSGTTTFQLTNNAPVTLTSSPQSSVQASATANVCNTGTVGGAGTINVISCSIGITAPAPAMFARLR